MGPGGIAFGIPDVWLVPSDHLCAFYRGADERDALLIPYLREGVESGDRCLCVVDGTSPEAVLASLAEEVELDLRPRLADGQIEILPSRDAYLRDGAFTAEAMMAFWEEHIGVPSRHGGSSLTRAVGEMTWTLRNLPGVEDFIAYEAELNRFLPRYPQVILCLYDLEHFTGECLLDILKTHPKVLMWGMVMENPFFVDPDEFLAARP